MMTIIIIKKYLSMGYYYKPVCRFVVSNDTPKLTTSRCTHALTHEVYKKKIKNVFEHIVLLPAACYDFTRYIIYYYYYSFRSDSQFSNRRRFPCYYWTTKRREQYIIILAPLSTLFVRPTLPRPRSRCIFFISWPGARVEYLPRRGCNTRGDAISSPPATPLTLAVRLVSSHT